jgi:hydroxylamine reductase
MFCYQCEQTAQSKACTVKGVCGKKPDVAALQDALVVALKGLAVVMQRAAADKPLDGDLYRFLEEGLFATLTNVSFDPDSLVVWINETVARRDALTSALPGVTFAESAVGFRPAADMGGLLAQAEALGIEAQSSSDADVRGLQHAALFGLKGVCAYAYHAYVLGYRDEAMEQGIVDVAADLSRYEQGDLGYWLGIVLKVGEINLKAMEVLDKANTETYGHPVPTAVPLGHKAGKAILVSGHDLLDLEAILKQTEGKGITVYTHGEMLPAHGYPKLKAYPHFYGNYGTAWQNQKKEFPLFPGAVLMTTNCLMEPQDSYFDNVFVTGPVAWPGLPRVERDDFGPVIRRALELPGFAEDEPGKTVMAGFGRDAILSHAGAIIDLVKSGKIRHFFLVGGCDGAKPGRNYYTKFVESLPKDTVVLTLACGKYRFYDMDLGDIEGIPRLLDVGQCNDAYSAVQVALALAGAFEVGVNDLPLSMILSWYEQKAVAILLSLLYLGIKNMRLGPTLPAFLTPNVVQYLVDNYNIAPITTPEADMAAILG